jgi:hypothetical protein
MDTDASLPPVLTGAAPASALGEADEEEQPVATVSTNLMTIEGVRPSCMSAFLQANR